MAVRRKDPAAVALGRKGGKRGGPARAAKLTPEQRSESARKAVQARWAKVRGGQMTGTSANTGHKRIEAAATPNDASDQALFSLLKRIKTTNDPKEVRRLSDQLERVIFHKQSKNA